ncbi:beta-ketoacyl synthase N-terminal-like domain-containing protein [Nonomuraea sp. SBT364]|uniref:beta-ketoacyl synthase N-terminal-like domain-containing protein n=1 Tax=Nonomuraea sp. SBT364 TaxID=1580530 RepID=UPI00066CA6A7|nr:beta-ketoacyl synthase N-terminal-like domain-containing protein [Nonomuraea sp. SBT364]
MPGVAICGAGAVASVGSSLGEMFEALCAGRSGMGRPNGFDLAKYRTGLSFEIDDRPERGRDVPLRSTKWLEHVIEVAAAEAELTDLRDVPILIGTTLRELRSVELRWRDGIAFDLEELHFGPALRRRFGAVRVSTVANACAASLYALALGSDLIEAGAADTVIVAGVDNISESTYGLLDRCYPEAPDALRPFDKARKGMLQGEGAAAVVLRRAETSRHGWVRSVAVNCDAHHPSAPDAKSIAIAMRQAHARAGVVPADIDLMMLHGTGTPLNDEAEARSVGDVFGGTDPSPWMTAIKSMTGHTAGASGLHSLLVAVESMRTGKVPPVVGVREVMEEMAEVRLVRDEAISADLRLAQINAFGFGGLNAVAVVERPC